MSMILFVHRLSQHFGGFFQKIDDGQMLRTNSLTLTAGDAFGSVSAALTDQACYRNSEDGTSRLISRDEYYSAKSERVVEDSYDGSLPAFVAAFLSRGKLTEKEAEEIQAMIETFRKEAGV